VIAIFTKFDQFKRDIKIKLEDRNLDLEIYLNDEVERLFNEQYLASLMGSPLFIRLESEDFINELTCTILIRMLQECTGMANNVLTLLK
jgi:hypothetical protein